MSSGFFTESIQEEPEWMDKEPPWHDWGAVTSVGKPGKAGVGMRESGDDFNFGLAEWKKSIRKIGSWGRKCVFWEHCGAEWQY